MDDAVMHDVVIIGAGMAGLRVHKLLRNKNVRDIVVVEAKPFVGGRVRSVYDRATLLYESGPWRIPQSHLRARQLFEEYDVPLTFTKTPLPQDYGSMIDDAPERTQGLSKWDLETLKARDATSADLADHKTGYADSTFRASGAGEVLKTTENFYVASLGFSELCRRMAEEVDDLRYNTRVVDVVRQDDGYEIVCSVRSPDGNFDTLRLHCRALFVCVPPHMARLWSVAARMASHLNRVEASCLHHIYARGPHPGGQHNISVKTPLVQTISDQYENGWFQVSYTAGRMARFWYNLRLSRPTDFVNMLERALLRVWPHARMMTTPRSHFWEYAYHRWRPAPYFNLKLAVSQSVYPNPMSLDKLFWAGEAFSSYQAWIEGALETAESAVDACMNCFITHPIRTRTSNELVLEDRILDVSKWEAVHPGSAEAIRNHVDEDVTMLFQHIGHSDHAWSIVANLQVAWQERFRHPPQTRLRMGG